MASGSLLRAVGQDHTGASVERVYHLDALGTTQAITGPGSSSSFLPSDETGLQLWLEGDYGAFQDAAMTTPATADGDPFCGWADRSGLGNHFTNSASTATLAAAGQNGRNTLLQNADRERLDTTIAPAPGS